MRSDHGPTIGVLSPLAGGFYFGGIVTGIARAAAAAGGRMIVIQTRDAGHIRADYGESPPFNIRLAWDHIAGFIGIINAVSPEYLAAVREAGKPLVLVSHEVTDLPCPVIAPDNRGGVAETVRHLVAHGHSRIAFAGLLAQTDIRERYDAYRQTLLDCGIEPDPSLLFEATDNEEAGGFAAGRAMLSAGLPSTAVVAATDLNAIGIMSTLLEAGYALPRDQAIVGFDDTEAAAHTTPLLSSVKQDFEQVGRIAGETMLECLRGDVAPGRRQVPMTFVARESCGCSPSLSVPPPVADNAGADAGGTAVAASPWRELATTLGEELERTATRPIRGSTLDRAVERMGGYVEAAAIGSALPPLADVRQALNDLYRLAPTPETASTIIAALRRFAHGLLVGVASTATDDADTQAVRQRIDDAVTEVSWCSRGPSSPAPTNATVPLSRPWPSSTSSAWSCCRGGTATPAT